MAIDVYRLKCEIVVSGTRCEPLLLNRLKLFNGNNVGFADVPQSILTVFK